MKAISLHIGLNSVDPDHYEGWNGQLVACEADANDMFAIAKKKKFTLSRVLLTKDADSFVVKNLLLDAAKQLVSGDLFVITYSGHGAQVPDKNGDEPDKQDETWVLYDRMLVDDEIYAMFAKFKAGVRIFVLSDSCSSGTVTRRLPVGGLPGYGHHGNRMKLMPPAINSRVYAAHKGQYDAIQSAVKPSSKATVKASVILISGCQDNQFSEDGDKNGLFTEQLLKVWNGGKFKGSHRRFRDEIAAKLPEYQSPNYYVVGQTKSGFEKQRPFTK